MKKVALIAALSVALLPTFAFAAVDPGTSLTSCQGLTNGLSSVVSCILGIMNNALYLIMAAAVLLIVWAAFQLTREDEKKREEAKKTLTYGIVGLFVMVSVWGLVNILDKTFNLSKDAKNPPALTPQSAASASASLKGPIQ